MNNLRSCEITMVICYSFPKFIQMAELCYISGKGEPTQTYIPSLIHLSFFTAYSFRHSIVQMLYSYACMNCITVLF